MTLLEKLVEECIEEAAKAIAEQPGYTVAARATAKVLKHLARNAFLMRENTNSAYVTAADVNTQLLRMSRLAEAAGGVEDEALISALWQELRHPPTRTDEPTEQFTDAVRTALAKHRAS